MTTSSAHARTFRTFFQTGDTRKRTNAPGNPGRMLHARGALERRAGLSSRMD